MCGIIGVVTKGEAGARDVLLQGLRRLEYRGYDSAGVALAQRRNVVVYKAAGSVAELERVVPQGADAGTGIAHTRWATHGPPSERNAHPHKDCRGRVVIVHNGIIENGGRLREELEARGHRFRSDTDSETIAHLIEEGLGEGAVTREGALEALAGATRQLVGSYAVACIVADQPETIFGTRMDAPLLAGQSEEMGFLASDATALVDHTRQVTYLEDSEIAVVTPGAVQVLDADLAPVAREPQSLQWDVEEAQRSGYTHFMLKEIHESPRAVGAALAGRIHPTLPHIRLEWGDLAEGRALQGVQLVACGTSLYAGMAARTVIETLTGLPVEIHNASEYRYAPQRHNETSKLVIAITQSGETADTLAAIREAKRRGHVTVAITNVVGSTAARVADAVLQVNAGPEIGVAATKSYQAQLAVLYLVALRLAEVHSSLNRSEIRRLAEELERTPRMIQQVLNDAQTIREASRLLDGATSAFYLGRQVLFPVALEGALKLKEISYIHAEGFSGGELKHGPFALLTRRTPVVGLMTEDHVQAKMHSNLIEVKARGAPLLVLTTRGDKEVAKYADVALLMPRTDPLFAPFPHSAALHLLAYHVAARKGLSIDKPRNLAKSVTVE